MIPKIIHYVWLGKAEIPAIQRTYMDGWHQKLPDWDFFGWTEADIPAEVMAIPYVHQAYKARKYAFVSDYVRLWALEQYGGVYLDTDVEVIRSFNELPEFTHLCQTPLCNSFIGFEESKAKTLGTNVIGCEPHCAWVKKMLSYYEKTPFVKKDGSLDMIANSELIARLMEQHGLVRNGKEQIVRIKEKGLSIEDVHVYDFHHFSPITSTRVMRRTKDTFSIHHCYGSWTEGSKGNRIKNSVIVRELINTLIQIKRLIKP